MPYRFLEEEATADVAFEAWGSDLGEVFRAAGEATINVMIRNLESIRDRERRPIELSHEALDLLLFDFLQRLIYFKDADGLLLRPALIKVEKREAVWTVRAEARGERPDPERHDQGVDVKAVTLHEFRLERTGDGWRTHVVLDI